MKDNKTKLPPFKVEHVVTSLSEVKGWGIQQMNIPTTWERSQGEGIRVLVIDTGFTDHIDIENNVIEEQSRSFIPHEPDIDDHQGHSTHCCGIIAAERNGIGMVGVAPKAKIITAKALDRNGIGSIEALENSLEYAVRIKPDIVSMSLGSNRSSKKVHELIKELYKMNIPVVCAAGNSGRRNDVNYPALYPETIAVTAFDKRGRPARFNSTGPQVDFSAPGVDIYSTWLNHTYSSISGTCLVGDTSVYTTTGNKYIKDIKPGDVVFSINLETKEKETNKVTNILCNGKKQTYKIKTTHSSIVATDNHPILVKRGNSLEWVEVKDLKIKDNIVHLIRNTHEDSKIVGEINELLEYKHIELSNRLKITNSIPQQPLKVNKELCQFIGAFLGDGYIGVEPRNETKLGSIGLCIRNGYKQQNKHLPFFYSDIFEKAFNQKITSINDGDLLAYTEYGANILKTLGLHNDVYSKRIPQWCFSLPREYKIAIISGLIDSDGWIGTNGMCGFELCNKRLVEDIKRLAIDIGILFSDISIRATSTKFSGKTREHPGFQITSLGLRAIKDELTLGDEKYKEHLNNNLSPLLQKQEKYMSVLEKELYKNGFWTEKIRYIKKEKVEEVYDITVENSHNFIANGIVVHNSMACPFIAGVIALLLSKHRLNEQKGIDNDCITVEQIKQHLIRYSSRGILGRDDTWGYGVVDVPKLISALTFEELIDWKTEAPLLPEPNLPSPLKRLRNAIRRYIGI